MKKITRWFAVAAGVMVLAAACGGSDQTQMPGGTAQQPAGETPEPTSVAPEESSAVGRAVPVLDRSIHNVPLEDIFFDTFGTTNARFVPLSEISDEL